MEGSAGEGMLIVAEPSTDSDSVCRDSAPSEKDVVGLSVRIDLKDYFVGE